MRVCVCMCWGGIRKPGIDGGNSKARCSLGYEQLYYCYYKHGNGCIYFSCVMFSVTSVIPHSSVPLHFLIFSFRCVIMNLPALLFLSPSSSSSSPSPHHAFIPLALSRRPPRPPLLLSTPWLCSVSSSPSSPPRRRCAV